MLNGRGMLLGVMCVLFVVSAAFGQQQSDTKAEDSALSESQAITIIKEIHASEIKMRDHIDDKFTKLDDKFTKLDDKFTKLDKEVAVLNNAKWYIAIIIAPISVYCSILLVQTIRKWNSDRKIRSSSKDTPPPVESDTDEFLDDSQTGYQTARG